MLARRFLVTCVLAFVISCRGGDSEEQEHNDAGCSDPFVAELLVKDTVTPADYTFNIHADDDSITCTMFLPVELDLGQSRFGGCDGGNAFGDAVVIAARAGPGKNCAASLDGGMECISYAGDETAHYWLVIHGKPNRVDVSVGNGELEIGAATFEELEYEEGETEGCYVCREQMVLE